MQPIACPPWLQNTLGHERLLVVPLERHIAFEIRKAWTNGQSGPNAPEMSPNTQTQPQGV